MFLHPEQKEFKNLNQIFQDIQNIYFLHIHTGQYIVLTFRGGRGGGHDYFPDPLRIIIIAGLGLRHFPRGIHFLSLPGKELSLCHKLKYLNPYIFRIQCCKPLIFQTQII